MNEIPRQFALPRDAEFTRLRDGVGQTDDDLAVQDGGACFRVIKRDHVRGTRMLEELFVELRHLGRGHELDA